MSPAGPPSFIGRKCAQPWPIEPRGQSAKTLARASECFINAYTGFSAAAPVDSAFVIKLSLRVAADGHVEAVTIQRFPAWSAGLAKFGSFWMCERHFTEFRESAARHFGQARFEPAPGATDELLVFGGGEWVAQRCPEAEDAYRQMSWQERKLEWQRAHNK